MGHAQFDAFIAPNDDADDVEDKNTAADRAPSNALSNVEDGEHVHRLWCISMMHTIVHITLHPVLPIPPNSTSTRWHYRHRHSTYISIGQ